jgi:hypothetical protein
MTRRYKRTPVDRPDLDIDPTTNHELHDAIWTKLKERIETQMMMFVMKMIRAISFISYF